MILRGFQPAFTSGELSPALCARVDMQKYDSGAKLLRNVIVRPEGGAEKAPGTRFIADTGVEGRVRLIPFSFNVEQSYVLEFSDRRIRILDHDGLRTDGNGKPVALASPYAEKDLFGIGFAQSADVLYLAHRSHPVHKLMRYGEAEWELGEAAFCPKTDPPAWVEGFFSVSSVSGKSRYWRYVITAVDFESGEESLPSPVISVLGSENMRIGMVTSPPVPAPVPDWNVVPIDDWYPSVRFGGVAGANEYRIYKETADGSGMFGYIGSVLGDETDASRSYSFADRNIAPNPEDTPPVDYNPFENGNHPSCVAIHQQRLIFAGSDKQPNTLWMSRSGNFENFTRSVRVKDDDSIEATLASMQINPVHWIVALRELIVGTTGAEWEITGPGQGAALTPGGVNARLQSARGSAPGILPAVVGNTLLHVGRNNNTLRDLRYDFSADSYGGADRGLFASHLFSGRRVMDIAFQGGANVLWCVMDDGLLLGLTFVQEHEIFAWHRHDTAGAYEDVCVIPGMEGAEDELFFVVRREVEGVMRRYIEKRATRFVSPENYHALSDAEQEKILAEAFCVHSGLSYCDAPQTEFHGLEHLEGRLVAVLADGAVHPPVRVTNGRITLRSPASVVHAGLPYASEIETVNFETQGREGTSLGKKKRIARVAVKFEASCGVDIGMNGDTTPVKRRSDESYGTPPRLRSGIETVVVPGAFRAEASVTVRSEEPVPFTILSIVPEVSSE